MISPLTKKSKLKNSMNAVICSTKDCLTYSHNEKKNLVFSGVDILIIIYVVT